MPGINDEPRLAFVPTNHHDYEYPVEVRPTIDIGNGVFATRDIEKGELCCFYDGIIVCSDSGMEGLISNRLGYGHDFNTETITKMIRDEEMREQVKRADSAIAGFTKQLRRGGVGQLINDWSMSYDDYDYDYLKNINTYAQCERVGSDPDDYIILMIAKKDIKKDSQLFYQYGSRYWKNFNECRSYSHQEEFKTFVNSRKHLNRGDKRRFIRKYNNGSDLKDYLYRYRLFVSIMIQNGVEQRSIYE